jgi:hypothetical protein
VVGRQRGEVAFGELGFDFLELLSQGGDASFAGGEPLFMQGLDVDGAVVLDFKLKFAAPVDEGGFGDFEFVGDAGKAPAFGAEADEALLSFDVIHECAGLGDVNGSGSNSPGVLAEAKGSPSPRPSPPGEGGIWARQQTKRCRVWMSFIAREVYTHF